MYQKDFPFPKYQKKSFGGKKINLAKKFFNLAKEVGPFLSSFFQFLQKRTRILWPKV
jgi:hypothetical protein